MSGKARRAPNLVETVRIIRGLGGSITEVLSANRHVRVRVLTQAGNPLILTLSKSKTDPKKLRDWIRQEFTKTDNRRICDDQA